MINPVTNKVPYSDSIISSCKGSGWDYNNLIYSYNFILILNEYVYSVKNISGIDRDYQNDPVSEGGNEWPVFIKNYSNSSFIKISLQRAMPIRKSQISSSVIRAGFVAAASKYFGGIPQNIRRKAALLGAAALDPIVTLENGPAIGIIQIFNKTFTKNVANFKFFSYGAERWSSGDLDAMDAEIVYENIDLVCSNLTRMTSDWNKGPSGIWNSGSDGSMYDKEEMKKLEKFRNAIHKKQAKIKELCKKEDFFTDKQVRDLENKYDELIEQIEDSNDEKKETEQEEERKMKEKAAEEVKKEIDRLERIKEWKNSQKN